MYVQKRLKKHYDKYITDPVEAKILADALNATKEKLAILKKAARQEKTGDCRACHERRNTCVIAVVTVIGLLVSEFIIFPHPNNKEKTGT